jgi:hypothetical protein
MLTNHDFPKSSTEDEKKLCALMVADRAVLRRRAAREDGPAIDGIRQFSDVARDNIRAARRRQAERNHKLKSTAAVPPAQSGRAEHG